MTFDLLTLDCAKTLLDVFWTPGGFAVDVAKEVGMEPPGVADSVFDRIFFRAYPEYREINLDPDEERRRAFWLALFQTWLLECGMPQAEAARLQKVSDDLVYGTPERYFPKYADTVPALEALKAAGVRMAVLSNWDYSLRPILQAHGLDRYFLEIHASMEVGFEKPHREFFDHVSSFHEVDGSRILHVGDNPLDDLLGARKAGWQAKLLDRSPDAGPHSLRSLMDLVPMCR